MPEEPFVPPPDTLRHEAGLRVRAFELAFQPRLRDPRARAAVLPFLQVAVGAFFSGRFDRVARNLDAARRSIDGSDRPDQAWADAWAVLSEPRLVDSATVSVSIRAFRLYDADAPAPARAELGLGATRLPLTGSAIRADVAANDADRPAEIMVDGRRLVRRSAPLARVRDLERRLANLEMRATGENLASLTAVASVRRLRAMQAGKAPENEFDPGELLGRAEAMARTARVGFEPGDWWVVLDTPSPCAARVLVPPGPRVPRPVVVALHGAGGSENMFFDAYGAGRIVDLCRRRGWLLVSPRTGVARPGEVVSALAKAVPIDPRRCFMIGHSMGAAAAIAGVPASPGVFAAVAALGGAGRIVEPAAWRGTRLEVGAGDSDFALGGAKALHASARAVGVDAGFREYAGIEHLGIVQAALDDVFAVFDGVARGRTAQ